MKWNSEAFIIDSVAVRAKQKAAWSLAHAAIKSLTAGNFIKRTFAPVAGRRFAGIIDIRNYASWRK